MKRFSAIVLLICVAISVTACMRDTDLPSAPVNYSSLPDSSLIQPDNQWATADENPEESTSESAEKSTSESTESLPPFPADDPDDPNGVSEFVDDTHEWEDGNYIYNPNAVDTTFDQRYYGDFGWTNEAKTLWTGVTGKQPAKKYDPDAAVAYGRANWDTHIGLCAEFISNCLLAGGITEFTQSSTSIALQLLNSRLGFGQFITYDKSDHTIPMPEYARPGDIVQITCPYEGTMIHSLLMVGTSQRGRLKAVCHNFANNGEYEFKIDYLNDPCYDCYTETVEVFFYHFYRDDDEGLPEEVVNNKDILLWESRGYNIQNEKYDRVSALRYAIDYPRDGVGSDGAGHTSAILQEGGLSIGYPIQSALFMQLLKSHQGSAYSLSINPNRTVTLPDCAVAGDICFVYCPEDGMMFSSFAVAGEDKYGHMIAHSYDLVNDGTSAFKVESLCPGCGAEVEEVILYHFDD